jgi:site-specific DNA-cytosine methylase
MKILIACEESQAVTIEFRKLGFEAFSNDIQECSGGHEEWHLKMDTFDAIDLLKPDCIIAFPPCTHLAVSGARHFAAKRADGRQQDAIDFFMRIAEQDAKFIAIENPIGIMSKVYRKPNQIIQPFWFGDHERKSTCLWLKNLPNLQPTDMVEPNLVDTQSGEKLSKWHMETFKIKDKDERSKVRSKTFQGIAKAMATQWGTP